jgi:hypothetical protein
MYWNSVGAHFSRCVYGDPVCSLTVTTYLLTFLTGGAFIAALWAATFAKETIEHEKAAVLALNACAREAKHTREARLFTLQPGPSATFTEVQTVGAGSWLVADFDCHNVGRSAVIDGRLEIAASPRGPQHSVPEPIRSVSATQAISLGNLLPNRWIHVKLHIDLGLRALNFTWKRAVHKVDDQIGLYTGTADTIFPEGLIEKPKPAAAAPTAPPPPAPPTTTPGLRTTTPPTGGQ